ncbi:HTH-type transcriptional regulator [Corynebacterium striatum]|uniref:DUF1376 domain-containing protein n=1 Tax=Corynebacterium striatum TaxID=43770 RepID=A0AAQ1TXT0_CORST|nr:hypothetical protein [Corynebacterium striatum]EEI77668.1 hypothetical protein HMPREF0308_2044 [Corynebacterium striatum ATCC 6940]QQE52070.1 hypothetical protein I6I11_07825 [Corynebacterium striatum]GEA42106.1 hypothetical protein Cst04h_02760 [Corynebacterium striatum]STD63128.1 HTH-type transcriptional regulator [Corynebacterium striatum]
MSWFKVDDSFYDHPKFLDVPNAAIGLWAKAGAWCGKHLTDGVIPATQVKLFKGTNSQINALISARIWIEDRSENGAKVYRFHDWNDYQPTREQKLKEREESAERQRKSRERKRAEQAQRENVTRDSHVTPSRDSHECHTRVSQRPDPTRPDPTRTSKEVPSSRDTTAKADGANKPAKKNHPIPEDWMPKQSTIDKMRTERPDLNLEAEHQNFMDYWQSITGAKARKADWDKTWLVWMRKQHQNAPRQKAPTNTTEAWLGTTNQPPIIDAEPQKEIAW